MKNNEEGILNIIGLSARAGKCISGETGCEKAIRTDKAKLVIVSQKASQNTKKKYEDMCNYRNIPLLYIESERDLGQFIGKYNRMVVVIIDEQFSHMILNELQKNAIINNTGVGNSGEAKGI